MSAIGWGNDCKQFKLSHIPGWLASVIAEPIINATLLYSFKLSTNAAPLVKESVLYAYTY